MPEDRRYLVDGVDVSCGNCHHKAVGGVIGQRQAAAVSIPKT
jgi:hypothetical protein